MTEGCGGGWAIFHGFLAENGGLMAESCAPYEASSREFSCSRYKGCKPIARVTKSYHFKDASDLDIKREILSKGAVITDWIPPSEFLQYKQGLMQTLATDDFDAVSRDLANAEPKPTHASVIIGWTHILGRNGN